MSRTLGSIFFCCCITRVLRYSSAVTYIFPKVLRPDTLTGILKGEGRRGRCLHVKVAVGFRDS